jgi:uncharacterized damage-inducible protein DinB
MAMDHLDYLRRLLRYDDWANTEAARSLQSATAVPRRAVQVLAHIVAAQWLWLARVGHDRKKMAVWPELSPDESATQLAELGRAWQQYLNALRADGLQASVSYTNSKGEPWTSTVGDVILHVVIHSSYHRGQIATLLGSARPTPAYTDFIHAVRQGFIE